MKTVTDPRVDTYVAKAAPFAQPILRRLRQLVHQACPEAEEAIKWGMPTFMHHGILCGMAGFKAHCAFWFRRQAIARIVDPAGAKAGKAMGNLGRITSLADLPGDRALLGYIRQAAKLNEAGVPDRPTAKARPAPRVPTDLAEGLRKNRKAGATFAAITPGYRREYVEWITEAKRPETRAKRLAISLAWLAEGKKRNWQYAC